MHASLTVLSKLDMLFLDGADTVDAGELRMF